MRKNPPTNYFFSFENCIGVTRNPRKIRVDYLWVRVSTNDYIVSNEIKTRDLGWDNASVGTQIPDYFPVMDVRDPDRGTPLEWAWATMVIIEMQVRGISICSKRPLGRCSIPLCLAKFSFYVQHQKVKKHNTCDTWISVFADIVAHGLSLQWTTKTTRT